MNTDERIRRIREIEERLDDLRDEGWRVENVTYIDESDEPFLASFTLSIEADSELDVAL